jgi:hypothetical protein
MTKKIATLLDITDIQKDIETLKDLIKEADYIISEIDTDTIEEKIQKLDATIEKSQKTDELLKEIIKKHNEKIKELETEKEKIISSLNEKINSLDIKQLGVSLDIENFKEKIDEIEKEINDKISLFEQVQEKILKGNENLLDEVKKSNQDIKEYVDKKQKKFEEDIRKLIDSIKTKKVFVSSGTQSSGNQSGVQWGSITGTLSNQTDLQSALDAKADDSIVLKKDGSVSITSNWNIDGVNTLYVDKTNGRVGIGTTNPGTLFTVGNNTFQVNSSGNLIKINNVTYSWPSTQGGANTVLTNDGSGNLSWGAVSGGGGGISGSGASGQVTFWTGASSVSGSNNLFWDNTNSRLGIGTIAPTNPLDIHINSNLAQNDLIRLTQEGAFASAPVGISFFNSAGNVQMASIEAIPGSSYTASQLRFFVANSSKVRTQRMVIDVNGNVGIGTTTPGTLLTLRKSAAGNVFAIRDTADASDTFTITDTGIVNLGTWQGTPIGVSFGGTGATTASGARTNLGAAASGINTDITALQGLNQQNAIQINPYGTGAGNTGEVRFLELVANGTNYVGFKAPDNIASNVIWTLPSSDGTNGQVLTTNGSGVLSWTTISGGGGGGGYTTIQEEGTSLTQRTTMNFIGSGLTAQDDTANSRTNITWDRFLAERKAPFYYTDFLGIAGSATVEAAYPFDYGAVSSGTIAKIPGEANHPGILRISSSTTANSGGNVLTDTTAFRIGGGEVFEIIFQPSVSGNTNTTIRMGFLDATAAGDATDGVYFELPANSLGIVGKTANNAVRTTSATIATLTVNTWYRCRIEINSNATQANFYVYDDSGTLLGSTNITTNIPTAAGRETGAGLVATNSGTTATLLAYFDFMAVGYNGRELTR